MSFRDTLKVKVGPERYAHIGKEAQTELSRALEMPLKDKFDADQYYSPRPLLKEFASEAEHFDKGGLRGLPAEVAHVVFRIKLLLATKNEEVVNQILGLI